MRTKFDAHQKPKYPPGIEERRARERLHCTSLILCSLDDSNGGLVFNITEDGMALSAARPLFDEESLTVQVQFPDSMEWMRLTGRIVWKSKSNKEIGILFVGVTEKALQQIRSWIALETWTGEFHSTASAMLPDSSDKGLTRMRSWIFSEGSSGETDQKEIAPSPRLARDPQERLRSWIWGGLPFNSAPVCQTPGEEQQLLSGEIADRLMPLNLECGSAWTANERQKPDSDATTDSRAGLGEPEKDAAQLAVQPAETVPRIWSHSNSCDSAPDRRSDPRVRIVPLGYLQLGESNGGVALNVSEGGVAITAAATLESDYLPRISLQFPDIAGWIEASGEIAWRSPSKKEAGVRFVGLTEEAQQRIRCWISTQTPADDAWQEITTPQEQDARLEIGECTELADSINSLAEWEGIRKQGAAFTLSFAADVASQHRGARITEPTSPAQSRGRWSRKALRVQSKRIHVQRASAWRGPTQRALATLFVLISSLLITWEWILPRGHGRDGLATSATAKTKPWREAERRERPSPVNTIRSPATPDLSETSQQPQGDEQRVIQTEHIPNASLENPRGTAIANARLRATPKFKVPSSEAPSSFTARQRRKQSWSLVAGVGNRPLERAPQAVSHAPVGAPQLEAKNTQPVSLLAVFPENAQPAVPRGKKRSAFLAKQPVNPSNLASAIAILADPYPSLRVSDVGSSKKGSHQMSLHLGHLLSDAVPVYPKEAKQQGIQGTAKLHAIIGRHGSVERLESIGGPPILVAAAMDAVWQWRYSETLLAGRPVETEVDVAVVFRLSDPEAPKP